MNFNSISDQSDQIYLEFGRIYLTMSKDLSSIFFAEFWHHPIHEFFFVKTGNWILKSWKNPCTFSRECTSTQNQIIFFSHCLSGTWSKRSLIWHHSISRFFLHSKNEVILRVRNSNNSEWISSRTRNFKRVRVLSGLLTWNSTILFSFTSSILYKRTKLTDKATKTEGVGSFKFRCFAHLVNFLEEGAKPAENHKIPSRSDFVNTGCLQNK